MPNEWKRNCNSCRFGMFAKCEALRNSEEYQAIWQSNRVDRMLSAHEFKENFICDQYNSIYIEYPIEVSKIIRNTSRSGYRDREIGKFVKIAPCSEEYRGKTYLGLYLGDLPLDVNISHNPESKELTIGFVRNPAIFVFELNKIIYGCESWWGIIESEEDLKEITQADIDDIWYVRALRALQKG